MTLALRAVLIAALLALIVAGLPTGVEVGRVWRLTGGGEDSASVAALLLAPVPPAVVLRDATMAPTDRELQALRAAVERTPLIAALPAEAPALSTAPPDGPRTGRYAAIGFTAHADSGDTVAFRLLDARDGVLDSVRVVADRGGAATGAFRIRPARAGWSEWRVGAAPADGDQPVREVGAWVAAAEPPRVLLVAGPPSWESRYVVRALEGSGVDVSLVQRIGRERVMTGGGAPEDWETLDALADYDVVVLLSGTQLDEGAAAALETWVGEGRGVAVASEGIAAMMFSGSPTPAAAPEPHAADALTWTAPAEIVPLPPVDIDISVDAFAAAPPGAIVAARTVEDEPVLLLAPFGRGRAAAVGIRETWRWPMEAGLEAEHRAFWRSLVDWLAVPAADSLGVDLAPVEAETGATVTVSSRGTPLALRRPGSEAAEALPSATSDSGWSGRFVPVDTGIHELRVAGATVGAVRALSSGEGRAAGLAWARLSLLAGASGGEALEPAAFAARAATLGSSQSRRRWWPAAVFTALVLLALTEWTLRRLRGRP